MVKLRTQGWRCSLIQWWQQWGVLSCIVVCAAILRLWGLGSPAVPYFDEVYHVPAVILISQGDWSAFEWWHPANGSGYYFDWLHPPFAKYLQAGSVWMGRTVFASTSAVWWRLPSALAGIGTVGMGYVVAKWLAGRWLSRRGVGSQLQKPKLPSQPFGIERQAQLAGLFTALIIATEGLLVVQSRVGMNDSIFVLLQVVSVWLFIRFFVARHTSPHYSLLFGVFMGVTLGTKWSGAFFWVMAMVTVLLGAWRDIVIHRIAPKKTLFSLPLQWFGVCIVPLMVYLALYLPAAVSHGGYGYVGELHRQIMAYQLHRDSNHIYASTPWQWFNNARPVWYWRDEPLAQQVHTHPTDQLLQTANIYAISHPLLPVLALIILVSSIWGVLKSKTSLFLIERSWWLCLYGVVWLPWVVSPRILFYYHYAPAIPLLAVLAGVQLAQWWQRRRGIIFIGIVVWVLVMIVWVPQWLGLRVPKTMADTIYFALPSWR